MGTLYYRCVISGTSPCGQIISNNTGAYTTLNLPLTLNAGNDQSICQGTIVALNATGAVSYQWSNGISNGQPFIPAITASYFVTGTASNGCTYSDTVVISVNPNPIVNAGTDDVVCAGSDYTLNATGAVTYNWSNNVTNGIPFTVNSSSHYSVIGYNEFGCSGFDMVYLETLSVPENPNVSTTNASCAETGTASVTNYSGALTYTFSPTGPTVDANGSISGLIAEITYIIQAINANSCESNGSIIQIENILANPNLQLLTDTFYVCYGQPTLLIYQGEDSYVWNNGVQNGIYFNAIESGFYVLTATNNFGCSSSDSVFIDVASNPYPQDVVLSLLNTNVLYCETANLDYYQWGYDFNGVSINSCSNIQYCFYPDFNTAAKQYWLEYKNDGECLRRVYYNPISNVYYNEQPIWEFYPNPSENVIHIEASVPSQINIVNLLGESIFQSEIVETNVKVSISIEHLLPGIYSIELSHQGKKSSKKLVKI